MNTNQALKQLNTDFIIDEVIWGHRIYDEQTPEMILLEFFSIFKYTWDNKTAFTIENSNTITYDVLINLNLRLILFLNPYLDLIYREKTTNKWSKWESYFINSISKYKTNQSASSWIEKIKSKLCKDPQNPTDEEFKTFAEIIFLLRGVSFEYESNKRWTSKFLFPLGENALFCDMGVRASRRESEKNIEVSVDRRFFARTGEILYLLLSRAQKKAHLAKKLHEVFFERKKFILNSYIDILQADPEEKRTQIFDASFLPNYSTDLYDNLCDDIIAILDLTITREDKFFYICQIVSLYLIIYVLDRSCTIQDIINDYDFVCEIVTKNNTKVRSLAANVFRRNNTLQVAALDSYIKNTQASLESLQFNNKDLTDSDKFNILKEAFFTDSSKESKTIKELYAKLSPAGFNSVLDDFIKEAENRHKKHMGKVHQSYGKRIGLVSAVRTNKFRYILSDSLLKTLVLCRVSDKVPLHDFLNDIYKRYHIVIGPDQAKPYIDDKKCDFDDFSYNVEALKNKALSLGLLKTLSDSCSYVINPFKANN